MKAPTANVTIATKASVRPSAAGRVASVPGRNAVRSRAPIHVAIATPSRLPATASAMLSVRIWVRSRDLLTPSARRTAISRRLVRARVRRRLATLAHAMRSTMSDTPLSQVATFATSERSGPRSSRIGPAKARGRSSARRCSIELPSAADCAR